MELPERDEQALAALREHEKACADRYLGFEKRLTAVEVGTANNTKLLWGILAIVLSVAAKEFLSPLFGG